MNASHTRPALRYAAVSIHFALSLLLRAQSGVDEWYVHLLKSDSLSKHDVREVLSTGSRWQRVAYYDVKKDTIVPELKELVQLQSRQSIDYVTDHDKLRFKGAKKFKVVYGGKGPEKQTFELKYFDGKNLVLQSTFSNKGYMNGVLAYLEERTIRYVWTIIR